ncbi:hypothetical protein GCM10023347_38810 [Streptomyces chumphonensis]|uniref:hypothetical protein n=1 Tax=Streptomyces chumphonensis TaxID=1214925 RepID=UPI00296474B2|nr:hypothetical protein [Streptomyces chumphonensis]
MSDDVPPAVPGYSADLSPLIAATARWLVSAYPAVGGAMSTALAEAQARQAATVAAWLRYPTAVDAALAALTGAGGSGRLDRLLGAAGGDRDGPGGFGDPERAWRTWVDEVVASWAACLLSCPELARSAVAALSPGNGTGGGSGGFGEFRRLTAPDVHDRRAAPLLRHPDLVAGVADLHRADLIARLRDDSVAG